MKDGAKFSLQFLGSGNARSKPPINYHTNILVRSQDYMWLIDCGGLCPLALHDRGISVKQIDGVFISHLHGDHVQGLEELMLTNYFHAKRRVDLLLPQGLKTTYSGVVGYDIWDNCLRASLESNVVLNDEIKMLQFDDFVNIHMLKLGEIERFYGVDIEIFPVEHVYQRPSYGLILDRHVFFTADCKFSRSSIESYFERGASIVFHDVTFAPSCLSSIHASIDELLTLPQEMAQRMVLMHYDDATTPESFQRATDHGFGIAKNGEIFEF